MYVSSCNKQGRLMCYKMISRFRQLQTEFISYCSSKIQGNCYTKARLLQVFLQLVVAPGNFLRGPPSH
uniref:Uncharacterized protein n=1 Tax=Populus trichocarpa TaxID=3694 RepID=A0A3N7FBC8_POPTR